MATILNTGQVFENATATTPIQTAEVNFETFNVDDLVMTKSSTLKVSKFTSAV